MKLKNWILAAALLALLPAVHADDATQEEILEHVAHLDAELAPDPGDIVQWVSWGFGFQLSIELFSLVTLGFRKAKDSGAGWLS